MYRILFIWIRNQGQGIKGYTMAMQKTSLKHKTTHKPNYKKGSNPKEL